MNEQFNQIRDAYQRMMFDKSVIDTESLYAALPDKSITNDQDENLYHLAARFTDVNAIRFLNNAGVKPVSDKYGNTPLHALTTTRFDLGDLHDEKTQKIYNTAKVLLDIGINPKKKNDSGKIAYFEAGLLYMYPFVEAMGDAGVKMDAVMNEGKNLLHAICDKLTHRKSINGAVDAATRTVRILLEKGGIDVDDKDIFGTTPLTYAQRSGVKEIAALLSGDESDVATGGMTVHEAVLHGDTFAIEALIKSGADLNELSDQYHRTPLMLACEYPSAQMVELLLTNGGADVNYRLGGGETAVYYLLTKGISNFGRGMSKDLKDVKLMLRTLINQGLNLDDAVNNDGDTALNLLCQAGYLADLNTTLAEELVEAGCDINKPNTFGKTPLMAFAGRGNEIKYNIAELLLDNKADTGYADKSGNTALMYAASNPDKMSAKKIVQLILDQGGADASKVNNAGQTAMDIAVKNDNEAVVKQLLEVMA